MHACPRHDPWKRWKTAKSGKGETRVPNAIIGTNQLRETTPTDKPRSSKVAGVEHKASNLVSQNKLAKESRQKPLPLVSYIGDMFWLWRTVITVITQLQECHATNIINITI